MAAAAVPISSSTVLLQALSTPLLWDVTTNFKRSLMSQMVGLCHFPKVDSMIEVIGHLLRGWGQNKGEDTYGNIFQDTFLSNSCSSFIGRMLLNEL